MHMRRISSAKPAPAFNVEQLLFVANGLVGLVNSVLNTGNVALSLFNGLSGFLKPAQT